ncbi:hypothetical protein ACFV2Q_13240 [Streptomyces sp. NPDC059650]|uniref:hypothetical protein n=1 Tax=Streptomyces sp. NPDC059650 TaxID=3346896 RepID=UPI00369AAC0F
MRLRNAAVAFLGAFALAVPLAGTSLADDFDDRPNLGRLDYIVDGERRQIRPADNDTCYELTGTSRRDPATAVRNNTKSRATLFTEDGCNGRSERELEPKDTVYDVRVRSVVFTPVHVDTDDKHDPFGESRSDDRLDDRDRFDSASRPEHAVMGDMQAATVLPAMDGPEPQDEPAPAQEQGRHQDHGRHDHVGHEEQGEQAEQGRQEGRQEEQAPADERQEEQAPADERQEEQAPADERQEEQPPADERQEEQPPADERQEMPGQPETEQQGPDMSQDMSQEHHEQEPDMFEAVFRSIP